MVSLFVKAHHRRILVGVSTWQVELAVQPADQDLVLVRFKVELFVAALSENLSDSSYVQKSLSGVCTSPPSTSIRIPVSMSVAINVTLSEVTSILTFCRISLGLRDWAIDRPIGKRKLTSLGHTKSS